MPVDEFQLLASLPETLPQMSQYPRNQSFLPIYSVQGREVVKQQISFIHVNPGMWAFEATTAVACSLNLLRLDLSGTPEETLNRTWNWEHILALKHTK